jgi:MFS family permease
MSNAQPTRPGRTRPSPLWAVALLCGASFMVILDGTIVVVALPSIRADLGFSEQALQWVIMAYALSFVGLLLHGGRAAPKPLRLANSQAPSTDANYAARARPVCGAASQ